MLISASEPSSSSRRRNRRNRRTRWGDITNVVGRPSFISIFFLCHLLLASFLLTTKAQKEDFDLDFFFYFPIFFLFPRTPTLSHPSSAAAAAAAAAAADRRRKT